MKRGCVLVVDDNEDACEVLCYSLQVEGYQVVAASTGMEAIEQARAHQPTVVLMDLQMPGLDGLEATRRMKGDATLREIPVIAYTAYPSYPTEISATHLFAAVLAKPCPLDRVLRTIAECQSADESERRSAPLFAKASNAAGSGGFGA